MPAKNARVRTPDGPGTVESVDLLKEEVTVRLDRSDDGNVASYPLSQLRDRRSDKE